MAGSRTLTGAQRGLGLALCTALTLLLAGCGGADGSSAEEAATGAVEKGPLTLGPDSPWAPTDGSAQLAATDEADMDVTDEADWRSADTAIATVNSGGLVSGVAVGTVTISAETDEALGETTFHVTHPAEGTGESPVALAVSDHDGTVSRGTSYYSYDAVDASTYFVNLEEPSDDADLTVYVGSAEGAWACRPRLGRSEDERCTVVTDSGGTTLLIRVDGPDALLGAEYAISAMADPCAEGCLVNPLPPSSEGSVESPQSVPTGEAYNGEVGGEGTSYYVADVIAGTTYAVAINSETAALAVYGSDSSFTTTACTIASGSGVSSCALTATASSLYISVSNDIDLAYSLSVYYDEGTAEAPVALIDGKASPGRVGDGSSYYAMPVTAGLAYTVFVQSEDYDLTDMFVDDADPQATAPDCAGEAVDVAINRSSISGMRCVVTPGGDTLYITVDGPATGASYTLHVGAAVSEGSTVSSGELTPVPQQIAVVALPYNGSVDTTYSYYEVPFEGGGQGDNTVYLTDPSDDVALSVYSDSGFSNTACSSDNAGNAGESCAVSSLISPLYIRVSGIGTPAGSTFTLDIAPPGPS